MSLDPHSLDRLRALGRQLPRPLPAPEPAAAPVRNRHPVETEQGPEQLFRELIKASLDGRVPPRLLNRLKRVEADQRCISKSHDVSSEGTQEAEAQLYVTFQQMLLETEQED